MNWQRSDSNLNQASRLTWDFVNKLLAADIDSTDDLFYKIDALGRRGARTAKSTTTIYLQSGQQTIADYKAGTAARSQTFNYVHASYIDEPVMRSTGSSGAKHFHHRHQQYSITAITDASATIVERYAYTAYGTPTITDPSGTLRTTTITGNRYTYTGREWDEALTLYHYGERMYDAVAGRFVSRDPIGFEGSMWSLYEYAGASPLARVDSSGMAYDSCWVEETTRRRVPKPGTSGRVRVIRLFCTIRCKYNDDIDPTEFAADLPHTGMADAGVDEMRCAPLLPGYYALEDCDDRERERKPCPDPVPVVFPTPNPGTLPRVAPLPPPSRPWWPSWLRPGIPSFPLFIIPEYLLPESGGSQMT